MRAACWFLWERLVVAWTSVGDGAEVGTVEVLASVAGPSVAPSEVEREWTAVHEGAGKAATATVLLSARWARSGLGVAAGQQERGTGDGVRVRAGSPRAADGLGGLPRVRLRAGAMWRMCGLVRCSANCGVGMRGAPEAADREVRVQPWRPDSSWADTIML